MEKTIKKQRITIIILSVLSFLLAVSLVATNVGKSDEDTTGAFWGSCVEDRSHEAYVVTVYYDQHIDVGHYEYVDFGGADLDASEEAGYVGAVFNLFKWLCKGCPYTSVIYPVSHLENSITVDWDGMKIFSSFDEAENWIKNEAPSREMYDDGFGRVVKSYIAFDSRAETAMRNNLDESSGLLSNTVERNNSKTFIYEKNNTSAKAYLYKDYVAPQYLKHQHCYRNFYQVLASNDLNNTEFEMEFFYDDVVWALMGYKRSSHGIYIKDPQIETTVTEYQEKLGLNISISSYNEMTPDKLFKNYIIPYLAENYLIYQVSVKQKCTDSVYENLEAKGVCNDSTPYYILYY